MKRWSKRGLSLMVSALVLLALMPAALVGAEPGYEGEPPAPPTAESSSETEAAPPANSGPQAEQEPSSEGAIPSDKVNVSIGDREDPLGGAAREPGGTIEPDGEPGQEPGAEGENGPEDEDTDLGPTWPEEEAPNEETAPARQATGAPLVQGAGGVLPAAAMVTVTGTAVTLDGLVAGELEDEIQAIVANNVYTDITAPEDITKLTVAGAMNEADMTYIWKGNPFAENGIGNLPNLQVMDLAEVDYDGNALEYDQFAFHPALDEVWLPGNLTSTGGLAFYGCTSLTSIDLPDRLISIGNFAFYGCTGLTSIDLPDGIISIGIGAFMDCTRMTSIGLPDGLTYIGNRAFSGCTSLTSIDLPDGLISIGPSAFSICTSLASIDLPDGLISIGEHAFDDCRSLTRIDLSGCTNLASIGSNAFRDCAGLTTVYLPSGGSSIVTLDDSNAFQGCNNTRIVVPASLLDEYKANTNWKAAVDATYIFFDGATTYLLEYSAAGGHGVVTPTNSKFQNNVKVYEGEEIELTAIANPGYRFTGWDVSGGAANQGQNTDNPAIFEITGDATITATFEQIPYTFTFEAAPTGGTVAAEGQGGSLISGATVYYGNEVEMTATPATGYHFTGWTATGANPATSTNASQTFTITGNASITARFAQITYPVMVNTPAEGGSASADKSEAAKGAMVTLTLSPARGYRFKEWSTTPTSLADEITGSGTTYTFTMPAEAVTIEPVFEQITHAISVSASPAAGGTVSGGGNVAENTSHTVTAYAASGYSFVNWTENGTAVSTSASYSFTVTGPRTLVANFKADPDGSSSSKPEGGGSSSSSSRPDTSNPTALAFTALPENNTVHVGDRFTLTPTEDGQKGSAGWAWDSGFFSATFNSPATFTALKAGSSTITYTAPDGRKASVTITIQAASSTSSSTAITQTGDNSLVWVYATMALLAAAAMGGLAILKKRRAK